MKSLTRNVSSDLIFSSALFHPGVAIAGTAMLAVGGIALVSHPGTFGLDDAVPSTSTSTSGFAARVQETGTTLSRLGAPWFPGFITPGLDDDDDEGAELGTQPYVSLHSDDPKHINTLRFNPCTIDDGVTEWRDWAVDALTTDCTVDASNCEFCAWVLQYDSEYRVNDIVTCLGPTFKVAAYAVMTMEKYKGTVLRRLLESKPKMADGSIAWKANPVEEAEENFEWMVNAIRDETCEAPGRDTLIVHIRAGDNLNDEFKNIPHIPVAINSMKQYVKRRPYIKRIELSSVLHFGVPAPDVSYYQKNEMDDGVGDAYMMTDLALRKNGDILSHFYLAAKETYRDVWFTSKNDPDDDMCRYAKACHFFSASLSPDEMHVEGPATKRLSFSELVRDLNVRLRSCTAEEAMSEFSSESSSMAAHIGKREGVSSRDAMERLHFDAEINRHP